MTSQAELRQSSAVKLIVSREFHWCRARLLHALAGAFEQGVLNEVLEELLTDDEGSDLAVALGTKLNETGWLTDEQYGRGLERGEVSPVNIFDDAEP